MPSVIHNMNKKTKTKEINSKTYRLVCQNKLKILLSLFCLSLNV